MMAQTCPRHHDWRGHGLHPSHYCDAFSASPAACYKMRSEQQSARQGAEREARRSSSARSVISFDAVLSFHLITNFHQNLKLFANLIVI
jgi:hypothetical protein